MLTRRLFCGCLPLAASFLSSECLAQAPASTCEVFTPERQQAKTPELALARLREGHARFLAGKTINCDLMAQIRGTAAGQAPFAAIIGCIDSRVPVELVFDQRIGDVFVARIAGNFVNTDIIGSMEFATKVSGAKLIVVLGHSECGAIKGAIDNVRLGNLTATLANIAPAVLATTGIEGPHSSKNAKFVQAVAETNARFAVQELTARSPILTEMVEKKELSIVSAMHDVATGRITFAA
ncbi:carbonic anhydrase [Bosea caraganae]|uniref:Carbonic anhydrase n=1 Tax=Bosea caraganae TaxID=2763117 RepID=A0A370LBR9_9HYPH|nr:carbonic anhydrase family protein [Bosea caraganae]RDJ27325.1 carbonic anhydrase [Bosea caraganae]RDJ29341.1 carbonic anhydrase [Bosea caraganae]